MSCDRMWRDYFQFTTRSLFIALTLLAIVLGGSLWFHRRYVEPRQHDDAIRQEILALRTRRPTSVTPRQWESVIAWTNNLHSNSLVRFQTDLPTLRRFHHKLSEKLAGDVDLQTIYWIWDEYGKVCPGGQNYQRFRASMQEEIDAGGASWGYNVP